MALAVVKHPRDYSKIPQPVRWSPYSTGMQEIRGFSMTKDQDSVVCGLRAPGTFIKVFGQGWDAAGPFQFPEQFFP